MKVIEIILGREGEKTLFSFCISTYGGFMLMDLVIHFLIPLLKLAVFFSDLSVTGRLLNRLAPRWMKPPLAIERLVGVMIIVLV